jgi:hypothetical protein
LYDKPEEGRTPAVSTLEMSLIEIVTFEQGTVLQNLRLTAQALGLSAFPNFARHESGWFEALGLRMDHMPASRYLSAIRRLPRHWACSSVTPDTPYPQGLEHDGKVLTKSYCPPYYPSMREAVLAVVDSKFGPQGFYHGQATSSSWREGESVGKQMETDFYDKFYQPEALNETRAST